MSRAEYEQFTRMYEIRHNELTNDMKQLEAELNLKIKEVSVDIRQINTKVDDLSDKVGNGQIEFWKLVATNIISVVVGVLIGYVVHFIR